MTKKQPTSLRASSALVLWALAACAHSTTPAPATRAQAHAAPASEPMAVADTLPAEGVTPAAEGVAQAAPIDLPIARPCEAIVTATSATDTGSECVALERVQPESIPLAACSQRPGTQSFRFDAEGRILEGSGSRYVHRANGAATRTVGRQRTTLRFDAQHNITRLGEATQTFDDVGRLLRSESRGRFVEYVYAADGTYTTRHNYPDADEFCVADLVEVGRDEAGRVAFDRYDHCGINETPRTIRYRYDASGALVGAEIDVGSDGSIDVTVAFRYVC